MIAIPHNRLPSRVNGQNKNSVIVEVNVINADGGTVKAPTIREVERFVGQTRTESVRSEGSHMTINDVRDIVKDMLYL